MSVRRPSRFVARIIVKSATARPIAWNAAIAARIPTTPWSPVTAM